MPPRDSNASFLFLVVLITGVAVAAIREGRDGSIAHGQGLSSSNALYSVSDTWRTSVTVASPLLGGTSRAVMGTQKVTQEGC